MKPSDLRIGNIVKYADGGGFTMISALSLFQYASGALDIEPIELTEEWLLRFGFKNWGDKYTFGLNGINIHHRKRGFVLRKSVPIIKYVHQLQNLYHSLTGNELKIQ